MKTIKIRIKDSTVKQKLKQKSRSVNYVWNYCNEASNWHIRNRDQWLSGYDLDKLTAGASKELKLSSTTIQAVSAEYALRRTQFKKSKLRWRGRKSLGWIPFKKNAIKINSEGVIKYNDMSVTTFQPERISGLTNATGSFVEDARGRWYICLSVESTVQPSIATASVGIDLGIKSVATLSSGKKIENNRYFRMMERKLANAQRHRHRKQSKNIHAKIANSRNDFLHKASTDIIKNHQLIVIGDLKPAKIAKSRLGKSMLDSGTGMFRQMLEYKANAHQRLYIVVNEHNTTLTCSICGEIPDSAPRGVKGLGVREWVCTHCHSVLDRDVNAAVNILRLGHQSLSAKSA